MFSKMTRHIPHAFESLFTLGALERLLFAAGPVSMSEQFWHSCGDGTAAVAAAGRAKFVRCGLFVEKRVSLPAG